MKHYKTSALKLRTLEPTPTPARDVVTLSVTVESAERRHIKLPEALHQHDEGIREPKLECKPAE